MIDNILDILADFRALATLETFERIFGPDDSPRFWGYYKSLGRDTIAFYAKHLTEDQQTLFQAFLSAQLPALYVEPRCVECGGELAETDIAAGEDVCLDCAAAIALESDAEASGWDADGIDYEPGSLLATVRVRLEDIEHGTWDE